MPDEAMVPHSVMVSQIKAAVRAENEACAKIAEEPYGDQVQAYGYDEPQAVGRKIAAAIRARAEQK